MLPEEVTRIIGQTSPVRIFEVEKGGIRKFADAVDDRNPLYWDDEYARNGRYGALIAPPGFFGWPARWKQGATFVHFPESAVSDEEFVDTHALLAKAGYPRGLDGGIEYEFFKPVRAGDVLAQTIRIKDIMSREGKGGTLVFIILEMTYTNQEGDLVARARATSIHR